MNSLVPSFIFLLAILNSTCCGQHHAILYPQETLSVCQGQSIAYNCIGSGTKMEFFSPPFINESQPLVVYQNNGQVCNLSSGSAAVLTLVNSDQLNVSFMGTLILYISNEYAQDSYSVFCRVSTTEGYSTISSTYFTVMKQLSVTVLNDSSVTFDDDVVSYMDSSAQVNVSWNDIEDAELFIVHIEELNQTFHIVESYFIATLPYGTYSATFIAMNRCGRYHQNFTIMVENTSAPPAYIVGTVLGAVFGTISGLCFLASACFLIFCCLRLRKNLRQIRYHNLVVDEDGDDIDISTQPSISAGEHTLGSLSPAELSHHIGPIGELPIPPRVHVYSARSTGRTDMHTGDKIVLSRHVLISCFQQEFDLPISFKLTNPTSGQFVYAGVKDFSSPSRDVAYLPQWMMEHLGASEGDQMIFEHVDLVPGTLVKLQPNSSTWLGIPEDTRKELMESHLREFQTLTEGMVITLTYELNRYNLKVLKCQPSQGILIQDVDIPTDVAEPADLADGNYSVVEGQAIKVGLDEPFRCQAEAKQYKYFMLFTGHQLPSRLSIEVKPIRGDPDLFISQSCITPSQSRYTWCNQDVGYSVIELCDEFDVNRPVFAGIVCLCEDSEFVITFVRRDTLAAARDRNSSTAGKNLRETNQNSIPTTVGSISPTEEYERCYYCHRVMQAHLMVMHERHCAQQTFKCPTCNACVPKSAENKHHLIYHEPLICECGCRLPQIDLHKHQEQDCIKRSVKCQYKLCNLWFPMDELLDHETLCETKCVPCPECQQEFMQKEVEEHMKSCHLTPDNANVV